MDIKNLIAFSKLLNQYQKVERALLVNGSERNENDIEHSYMLSMLAWYICSSDKLKLDIEKVLKYALAHDIVEVYAGDTHFFHATADERASKHEREQKALERIAAEFPEFSDLKETLIAYENRADEEAKFVYALDKMQPVIQIYLDGGRTWNRDNITLDMLKEKKNEKMKYSPEVAKYWDELLDILEEEKNRLFEKE